MTSLLPAPASDAPSGPAANGRHRRNVQSQNLATVVDGLEHRLATQPVIEQSKGILIGHLGIDPDTAFDVLRRWSSHTNLKVRQISQLVVTTATANPPVILAGPVKSSST